MNANLSASIGLTNSSASVYLTGADEAAIHFQGFPSPDNCWINIQMRHVGPDPILVIRGENYNKLFEGTREQLVEILKKGTQDGNEP
jgi:hypothetical protein